MTSGYIRLALFFAIFGAVMATWSMSSYACNQPQLYQQCNCQSFCGSYVPQQTYSNPCSYGYGNCGSYPPRRRHHHRRRHHKKPRRKFVVDSDSDSVEVPALPPRKSKIISEEEEDEGFIEQTTVRATTVASQDSSWENEDLWEKKFENRKSTKTIDDEDEFPEIDSAELEAAQRRRIPTAAPVQPGLGGGGLGGLGLGNGGLFGISSGVGVGVPGVGPIGVSSGLGIGK
ncbi:unnamed protein product [Caenorhabditis angaria]|uniref:Uncharacterized protein n=1 Tax=Caenorhabditis angaria TaxID=860376 RepID=A0A9P1N074_9PELO|nr:unnamed protein product [Caenorhabditis angaria]